MQRNFCQGYNHGIERLLGHNLALDDQALLDHVRTKIDEKESELGLQEIGLDHNLVDWPKLIHAAAYRNPPFDAGEKEKGFRDALVAESFLQLLAASPKTPSLCRVVLVTSDRLLTQAVRERIADWPNASVLASVEELKGLISTIVSDVGEAFIAQIKPKAAKLFFVSSDDKETVYYKEEIRRRLTEKFESELEAKPQGTSFRKNGKWLIAWPNFSRKESRRIFWVSRIDVELEAGTLTSEDEASGAIYLSNPVSSIGRQLPAPGQQFPVLDALANLYKPAAVSQSVGWPGLPPYASEKRVITHKGIDVFEVLWSTQVTMSRELRKPVIEDIRHIELRCLPIS